MNKPKFAHLGIYVRDMETMVRFYTEVMGQTISDRGQATSRPMEMCFFSNDPDEHHQFILVSGRKEGGHGVCEQMSFRVSNIEEVRAGYERAKAWGVDELRGVDHGNAISVYFSDPEGNKCEIYMVTPWHVPQPNRRLIDFSKSNEEILKDCEANCRTKDGFMSASERHTILEDRIGH